MISNDRAINFGAVDPIFAKEVAFIHSKRQSELSAEQRYNIFMCIFKIRINKKQQKGNYDT